MNKVSKTVEFADSDKKIDIYVTRPNHDIIKRADRQKAKTWNQCIRDGVITKKELGVLMEERGIWSQEKTKQEENITKQILELEKKPVNIYQQEVEVFRCVPFLRRNEGIIKS